jgi:hypothetical protein
MQECQSLSVLSNLYVIVNIWKGKRSQALQNIRGSFVAVLEIRGKRQIIWNNALAIRGFRKWPRRHRITDLDKAEFQSAGGLPNCFSLNTGLRFAKCCDCFLSVEVNRSFGPLKLTSKVTKSKSVNIP